MRRLKTVVILLILALCLNGCSARSSDDIIVDISILENDSVSLERVRETLAQWPDNNPGTSIVERESIGTNDLVSLASMGVQHLPDVFVADSRTGRLLAQAGLAVDLTGLAPDVDAFTYNGIVYAYPVLTESVSVIVYDPLAWHEGDPVGYDSRDPYTFIDCYMSSLIGDEEGQAWLDHMISADMQASFTDDYYVGRINETLTMLNEDIAYDSEMDLIEAFVSGQCHAVFVSGTDVSLLLNTLRTDNPGLYERTEFSSLSDNVLPFGYRYGVYIRSDLDDDRLVQCVRLASAMASSAADEETDDTIGRLNGLTDGSDHSAVLSQYFVYNFWSLAYEENYDRLINGDVTAEEFANILQNYFEMYYIDY